jgi:uncharacterized protein (DUF2252 family)
MSQESKTDMTVDEVPGVAAPRVEHFTVEERTARGKMVRAEVPRSVHAAWEPPSDRRGPVELLEEQARTRLPELVPIRYGRMLVSPFAYYRGAAYVMASDLSGLPRTGLRTQLCGDAHLSNFGGFAAPDRRLVFSINDFDETLPGPFEWDVKRLVASFEVAARDRGFDDKQRSSINLEAGRAYRKAMAGFATAGNFDLWYRRIDVEEVLAQAASVGTTKQLKRAERNIGKARTKDSLRAFSKLTELVDGEPRIISDPPTIEPIEEVAGAAAAAFEDYLRQIMRSYRRTLAGDRRRLLERYRLVHAARKVVGVGSVGTRAWIMLLLGRDESDPLFLQFKEAEASVLEPFLGKSEFSNHGQRVVEGQRLTQAASDIMLGWTRVKDFEGISRDFYGRQLWDAKASALVELMEPNALRFYAMVCGTELARAHARAGDAIAIASYLGGSDTFDRAVAAFAESYANQNERDYDALKQAVESGRINAEKGV